MASDVNVTGIVFAAIFGGLFIFTCIVSAIKAVRDRGRIKQRIAEKRRLKLEKNAYDNFTEIDATTEIEQSVSRPNNSIEVQLEQSHGNKSKYTDKSLTKCAYKSKPSPVRLTVPQNSTCETVPPWKYIPSHHATKNIIRRNSYDMAIGKYTVICGKYGEDVVTNGTTSPMRQVAYDNIAFNDRSFDQTS